MTKFFVTLKLSTRLNFLLVGMLLGLIAVNTYSLFQLRQHMLEEKRQGLRSVIQSAFGVIEQQYALSQAGKLSREDAQRLEKVCITRSEDRIL